MTESVASDRPDQRSRSLLGVVLCGGRSSRMGRDKSTLPLPGAGSFAEHAIQRLQELCERVCIAGESAAVTNAEVLQDPSPFRGPAVGIANALAFANRHGFDACLVTPVDMPHLAANDLAILVRAWQREGTLCCVISDEDERVQPLVAIYPTSMLEDLERLAGSEQRSLTHWMGKQTLKLVRLSARSCRNVNTPEDLIDL